MRVLEVYWKNTAQWETCSLDNYDQLNPICLHMFVSNGSVGKACIDSLECCDVMKTEFVSGVISKDQNTCVVFCSRSPVL